MIFRYFGNPRGIQNILLILTGMALVAIAGCTPSVTATAMPAVVVGSCGLNDSFSGDDAAIAAVLNAESEFLAEKNIDALMNLWAANGVVSDAMHTPNDPADDRHWRGEDAIRQRYVYRVFPGAPAVSQPKSLEIVVSGAQAVVTGTTRIGDEVSPGGDLWTARRQSGCWLIQSLAYNREP